MALICPNCRKTNEDKATTCWHCHRPFDANPAVIVLWHIENSGGEIKKMYGANTDRFGRASMFTALLTGLVLVITGVANSLQASPLVIQGISVTWGNLALVCGGVLLPLLLLLQWKRVNKVKKVTLSDDEIIARLREEEDKIEGEVISKMDVLPLELAGIYRILGYLVGARIDLYEMQKKNVKHLIIAIFVTLGASGAAMLASGIDADSLGTIVSGLIFTVVSVYLYFRFLNSWRPRWKRKTS